MFKFINSKEDETVYNLVQHKDESTSKQSQPLYRSMYSAKVRKDAAESRVGNCKSFGIPIIRVDQPSNFLKKHSKRPFSTRPLSIPDAQSVEKETQAETEKSSTQDANKNSQDLQVTTARPKTCQERLCNNKKPPIPCANTGLQYICQENKDFVRANAQNVVNNSKLVDKPKVLRYVDMSNGNTLNWYNSGLSQQYVYHKNFGKVPQYVVKRKKELQELHKASKEETGKDSPEIEKLEKNDVNIMVARLKENWNKIFFFYQALPLQIDTPGKIKRKARIEEELKKLEKDIQTLQRHDLIYVADVSQSYYVSTGKP